MEHQSHNMLEVNGKKTKNKTKDKRQGHNTIILQMKHVIIKPGVSKMTFKGLQVWLIYKKKSMHLRSLDQLFEILLNEDARKARLDWWWRH